MREMNRAATSHRAERRTREGGCAVSCKKLENKALHVWCTQGLEQGTVIWAVHNSSAAHHTPVEIQAHQTSPIGSCMQSRQALDTAVGSKSSWLS